MLKRHQKDPLPWIKTPFLDKCYSAFISHLRVFFNWSNAEPNFSCTLCSLQSFSFSLFYFSIFFFYFSICLASVRLPPMPGFCVRGTLFHTAYTNWPKYSCNGAYDGAYTILSLFRSIVVLYIFKRTKTILLIGDRNFVRQCSFIVQGNNSVLIKYIHLKFTRRCLGKNVALLTNRTPLNEVLFSFPVELIAHQRVYSVFIVFLNEEEYLFLNLLLGQRCGENDTTKKTHTQNKEKQIKGNIKKEKEKNMKLSLQLSNKYWELYIKRESNQLPVV